VRPVQQTSRARIRSGKVHPQLARIGCRMPPNPGKDCPAVALTIASRRTNSQTLLASWPLLGW